MNILNQHFNLLARNWKLGLMIFTITILFLLPAILVSDHFEVNSWWFIMTSLPIAGMALAFFVAETQKNLMSNGIGFLLPGLGESVVSTQMIIMSGLGIIIFVTAFLLPQLESVTTGNVLLSLSLSFLAMALFTITLIVDFLFRYSSYLTSAVMFPFFGYISLGKNAELYQYNQWFDAAPYLLIGLVVLVVVNIRVLMALNLPRRLAEQPYLSTLHLYKPDKVQNFKNRHAAHAQTKDQSARPLKNTMDACLAKSSRAQFAGHHSWAIFWDTMHLALSTGTPRSFLGPWNYVFFIFPFILFVGYFDSLHQCDSGMVGWYSAFPFMFATLPVNFFHYMGINPMGFPRNKKATENAGYLFVGWALISIVAMTLCIFGLLHLLSAVMPEFETATRVWSYHAPARLHTPFLPLFVMPVALLVYLFSRPSWAQGILGGIGMQLFLLFNFLLSGGDYGWPLMVALGVALGACVAFPFAWRWRIRRGY